MPKADHRVWPEQQNVEAMTWKGQAEFYCRLGHRTRSQETDGLLREQTMRQRIHMKPAEAG